MRLRCRLHKDINIKIEYLNTKKYVIYLQRECNTKDFVENETTIIRMYILKK